eukprot:c16267_g1_i5.p1 GENE.c16267_g1_i5~~c16267_g1_i5.p1  ORF type:complete len:976 (+),score=271.16 c16267_g1_i5:55-2982(+)
MKSSLISNATSAINMRGLTVFISDIRQCQSKEAEQRRVDKELANVRQKFIGNASLNGYQKKKYVWKLLYIHMLGYEVDFGHMEAINLITSNRFSEKNVGYLACTLLLHEEHELLALLINSMRSDILSQNEHFQTLALSCITNIGSKEFAEALAPLVMELLTPSSQNRSTKHVVKKRACLCLLRLYRKVPEILTAGEWAERMVALLDERNMGLLTSAMGLLLGILARNPIGYEEAYPKICRLLTKYVVQKDYPTEYTYYNLPSPWLQVKLLRALQYFPPPEDRQLREVLHKVLQLILNNSDMQKNVNKNNAIHAVLFEAIKLVIHLGRESNLLGLACNLLGKFIVIKDSNLRYLGMETMALMAEKNDVTEQLSKHQSTILAALFKETDISIRKRCLDLLFNICDDESAKELVAELLRFLETAEYQIKEDVVLKVAVLAERHADNYEWYVDVVLRLISLAGDFVAEDVWWRVVQIVTNNEAVQAYAAKAVFEDLKGTNVHDTIVKIACHVLGEYADLIVKNGHTTETAVFEQLQSRLALSSSIQLRAMLVTALAKLENMFPSLGSSVQATLSVYANSIDAELQQRAWEYLRIDATNMLGKSVFELMPAFPERESTVLKLVKKKMRGEITDVKEAGVEEDFDVRRKSRVSEDVGRSIEHDEDDGDGYTPTAPQAPSGLDTLLDLGDVLPTSQPAQSAPSSGGASLNDLFNLAPTPVAPVLGLGGVGGVNQLALKQHQTNVLKLSSTAQLDGVLYEDDNVQIGVKAQFQNFQGKVAIFFGNKSTASMTNVNSVVDGQGLDIQSKPPGNVLAGHQQAQHLLMLSLTQPFSNSPTLNVSFVLNGVPSNLNLTLPITPVSFATPKSFDTPQDFFAKWNGTTGQGRDRQVIFKGKDPLALQRTSLDNSLTQIHLLSVQGMDPNPANAVGSGVIVTADGSQHFALVRLEINPKDGLLRSSVRCSDSAISLHVERLLKFQLSGEE